MEYNWENVYATKGKIVPSMRAEMIPIVINNRSNDVKYLKSERNDMIWYDMIW